ncbi:hypothetical protein ACFSTE_14560 [Aquimarina hainanensis]|uniref:Secreted protein n=1 Tax=Aquimarina hainanensis TaxID=1578017 RepID=A0ABW5NCZ0_9FLAO|nr:hypothetical protein [Aquimarina sp. TRL1]QKX03592.1 hypothetical protein HN014_01240 [Aquimarina sp. TRL1]
MLFFAVSFLAPRIANLHVLDHLLDDDTAISCELCDFIVYINYQDLINDHTSYIETKRQNVPSSFVVENRYNAPKEKIVSPITIYNKPPPLI